MYRIAGCTRCEGDQFLDRIDDEWTCLQCGKRVEADRAVSLPPMKIPALPDQSHNIKHYRDSHRDEMFQDWANMHRTEFFDTWSLTSSKWSKLQRRWREKVAV